MVLVIGLEQPVRSGDPFGAPHIAIDERRKWTRLSAQSPPETWLRQQLDGEPSVSPAQRLSQQAKTMVLPSRIQVSYRLGFQVQAASPRGHVCSRGVNPLLPLAIAL